MRLRTGTSGWSYPEWKGHFYPEKLATKDMLAFYGTHFSTVEVNNTFHRMPRPNVLEGWASVVPDDFSFVLKVSQSITHFKRLKNAGDSVDYLVKNSAGLGAKLGPYLVQLPPNLRKDAALLRDFLPLFPPPTRCAVEFRHTSWYDDETYAILRERNASLCIADTGEEGDAPLVATADWGYLRLRKEGYDEAEMRGWRERVQAQPWKEAFVFFKHEFEGAAAKMAERFSSSSAP
ncbi:MAG TPA: DUF72 domain-containing protein [Candidatus Eisenbacteria bacterium]|nr:DUF72 domain-containing protein [Candidatus Eisenbacteria bacterium]